jgi:hypothetical protein
VDLISGGVPDFGSFSILLCLWGGNVWGGWDIMMLGVDGSAQRWVCRWLRIKVTVLLLVWLSQFCLNVLWVFLRLEWPTCCGYLHRYLCIVCVVLNIGFPLCIYTNE